MAKKSRRKDIRRKNALEFRVSQGINVGLVKSKCGRRFSEEAVGSILSKCRDYTDCYGCYIYSVRAGKGYTPIYVGSATKRSLGVEAFAGDKRLKCLQHMANYGKGTLHITFVVPKDKVDENSCTRRGRCPENIIKSLEKVLIAVAYRKNESLINKQNRCLADFYIKGALNSDGGFLSKAVFDFKDMMGMWDKEIVVIKTNR